MAVTGIDDLIGGDDTPIYWRKQLATRPQSRFHTYWGVDGVPTAGTFSTDINGAALSSPVTGQIPYTNATGGKSTYSRWAWANPGTGSGTAGIIADRIWHNGGYTITSTAAQNSTTPTWGARDDDGSTNGKGVYVALEISAAVGTAAGTPTVTLTYTNSAGTGSRTATLALSGHASATTLPIGAFAPFALSGASSEQDAGTRSVQSLQISVSWVAGTMNLVAYRPLMVFGGYQLMDWSDQGLTKWYDGSVPWPVAISSSGGGTSFNNICEGGLCLTRVA